MAEHFSGRDFTVHTSNGGGEAMFRAWVILLERKASSQAENEVLEFLQSRLNMGAGLKAFGLEPPPAEIAVKQKLQIFADVIENFAAELANENPDATLTDISWDRKLRLRWLAKMMALHELVCFAINEKDRPEPLTPLLNTDDRNECELQRLLDRRADRERQAKRIGQPVPADEEIGRLDELIIAASSCRPSESIKRITASLFFDRGCAKYDQGHVPDSIADLQQSAAIDPSEDTRQETLNMIQIIEE